MCNKVDTLEKVSTNVLQSSAKRYLDINFASNDVRGAVLISVTHQTSGYKPALFYAELSYGTGGVYSAVSNLSKIVDSNTIIPTISADNKHIYVDVPTNSWCNPVLIPLGSNIKYTASWLDSIPT